MDIVNKKAKGHKSHVADAGIGNQFFNIFLRKRKIASVYNSNNRKYEHRHGKIFCGKRKHWQRESQKSVSPHFKEYARQDYTPCCRGLHMRIRQPCVEWKH